METLTEFLLEQYPWAVWILLVLVILRPMGPFLYRQLQAFRRNRRVSNCTHSSIDFVQNDSGTMDSRIQATTIRTGNPDVLQCTQCGAMLNRLIFTQQLHASMNEFAAHNGWGVRDST